MTPEQAFSYAYNHTVAIEGGYVNDPADRGGETYMGVSRKHHSMWIGWHLIDDHFAAGGDESGLENIEHLQDLVKGIYFVEYWNAMNLSSISAISWRVAVELFDSAVNCGTGRAAKWLQKAINLVGRNNMALVEDGAIGPKTIEQVQRVVAEFEGGLVKTLNGLQFEHYHRIVQNDPGQKRFIRGWLRRVWEEVI